MPTAFDNLTAIPCSITQGEVVTWAEDFAEYPGATYGIAYKLASQTPLDGFQQVSIAGTETSTATYTFATANTMKPGIYAWERQVTRTSDSVMRVVERGQIVVIPNLSTAQTTTTAATAVSTLETAIATLNASTNSSVSFNGQSYSRANLGDYQSQLTFYKAKVIREQEAWRALLDYTKGGRILGQFTQ